MNIQIPDLVGIMSEKSSIAHWFGVNVSDIAFKIVVIFSITWMAFLFISDSFFDLIMCSYTTYLTIELSLY